ncbi:Ger(x)C family spore germination protein, partial [Caproiciproducens sp.]|uniref:Ger(x)C family spore germination protein n=1 Tax=Caproiciproducens sp. TaxID=1954376 RepID=UPI00289DB574
LTDAECRETVGIVVSQEKTAKDILNIDGLDNSVVAFEIKKILQEDQNDVGTIENVPLFRAFSILESPGRSIVLPAFHNTKNNDKKAVEANGEAVFKGDKMIGYLSQEDSKYYLFAVDGIHGGILTLSSTKEEVPDVSLEISKSTTKRSYSYSEGKLKVMIRINTDVYLDEIREHSDLLDENKIKEIEKKAQKMVEDRTSAVIQKVQTEYNSDIFGFGNMIYKKDLKLWKKMDPQWDKLFPSIQVEVQSKVNIVNTSFVKRS